MKFIRQHYFKILLFFSSCLTAVIILFFMFTINSYIKDLNTNPTTNINNAVELEKLELKHNPVTNIKPQNDDFNLKSIFSDKEIEVFFNNNPIPKNQAGQFYQSNFKKENETNQKSMGTVGKAHNFRRPTEDELNDSDLYQQYEHNKGVFKLKEKVLAMKELKGRVSTLKGYYSKYNLETNHIDINLNDIDKSIKNDSELINKFDEKILN